MLASVKSRTSSAERERSKEISLLFSGPAIFKYLICGLTDEDNNEESLLSFVVVTLNVLLSSTYPFSAYHSYDVPSILLEMGVPVRILKDPFVKFLDGTE